MAVKTKFNELLKSDYKTNLLAKTENFKNMVCNARKGCNCYN